MGTGIKRPTAAEKRNMKIARKSLVAACPIKKGETFSADNITVKRPGTGLSPMLWDWLLGKKSPRDFRKDEIICL
jgi:sialic acid synthase SpsE